MTPKRLFATSDTTEDIFAALEDSTVSVQKQGLKRLFQRSERLFEHEGKPLTVPVGVGAPGETPPPRDKHASKIRKGGLFEADEIPRAIEALVNLLNGPSTLRLACETLALVCAADRAFCSRFASKHWMAVETFVGALVGLHASQPRLAVDTLDLFFYALDVNGKERVRVKVERFAETIPGGAALIDAAFAVE